MKRVKSILWAAGMCWLLPLAASGKTYNVTPNGTGLSDLTGAIGDADLNGGTNTINLAAGTYMLTAEIQFGNQAETINFVGTSGAGSTVIMMGGATADRIFLINPPGDVSGVNVSIQGITFENGVGDPDGFGGGAILCGGPSNTTTITNCIFLSNSLAGLGHGGALAMEGGGTFTVSGCTFSKNSVTEGNGGAIYYLQQNGVTSSLTITNCTFKGNQVIGTSLNAAFGGAMRIEADASAAGNTSAVSVTQDLFDSNKVSGPGSMGGAISIENSWAGVTDFINFNRFYQNTGTIPDLICNSSSTGGAVNITNNWWGSNAGPVATGDPHVTNTGSGTLTTSPWLELHTADASSFVCGGSGGAAEVVTAGFLTNSAGTSIAAANLGAMTGTPVSFTATHGTISGAQTAIQSSGTATANFTANITPSPPGSSITAVVQSIADSVSSTDGVAQAVILIHAPSVGAGSTTGSVTASAGDLVITDASCNQICNVVPSGAFPVSGTVNATVTVDPSVQSVNGTAYVVRHYDLSPVAGASTATGTITLYFTQSDFNSYNLAVTGSGNKLPTSSSDMTGRGNLTITQYHGTGTAPGNYTGWTGSGPATVLITPGASNVVWDPTDNWWTVTFTVTGFSGFFVTGPVGIPLPVTLESFSGQPRSGGVLLSWTVGIETGMASYEVDGSSDGVGFTRLGTVAAAGASGYQYFDADGSAGDHFYRLRMVNLDGTYSYSNIVLVKIAGENRAVQVLGNPVSGNCTVRIVAASAGQVNLRLADVSGKTLWVGSARVGVGANTIVLPGMDRFAAGVYVLSVDGGQVKGTVKVVKEF
jgi:hypothetical protein